MPINENQTPLRERLKADLLKAMKARQNHIVSTLRSILSEIDNAEAVKLDASMVPVVGRFNDVPRKILSETQIEDIVRREFSGLETAHAEYLHLGKLDEAAQLRAELDVLAPYVKDLKN